MCVLLQNGVGCADGNSKNVSSNDGETRCVEKIISKNAVLPFWIRTTSRNRSYRIVTRLDKTFHYGLPVTNFDSLFKETVSRVFQKTHADGFVFCRTIRVGKLKKLSSLWKLLVQRSAPSIPPRNQNYRFKETRFVKFSGHMLAMFIDTVLDVLFSC